MVLVFCCLHQPHRKYLQKLKELSTLRFAPPSPIRVSQNAIDNKGYYDVATTLYYFSNKERKRIDRPKVIGVAKGVAGGPLGPQ